MITFGLYLDEKNNASKNTNNNTLQPCVLKHNDFQKLGLKLNK